MQGLWRQSKKSEIVVGRYLLDATEGIECSGKLTCDYI